MHTDAQIQAARVRAAKFAAFLAPTANASEAEAAKALAALTKLCAKFGFAIADFIAEPAQPKQPRDKAQADKRDQARAAQAEAAAKCRELARRYYNGASCVAHMRRKPTSADCFARVADPIQRMRDGTPSERDLAGLALALSGANSTGVFDPTALYFDLGVLSRLASGAFVDLSNDGAHIKLTPSGLARAKATVAKAA